MKTSTRLTIGLGLAGCAAVLIMALRTDPPPAATTEQQKRKPGVMSSHLQHPLAAKSELQAPRSPHTDDEPLLPPPVLAAEPSAAVPGAPKVAIPPFKARPMEESMMLSWAARDPEGAGRWLNQNRNHPKFADMVRGYAIQIATTDPAAARQWAAVLNGNGNRFAYGATLEQHIDAVEAMLKGPAPAPADENSAAASLAGLKAGTLPLADYTPRLVRQNPGEPPVLEMQPTRPDT